MNDLNDLDQVQALVTSGRRAPSADARARVTAQARALLDDARVAFERSAAAAVLELGDVAGPLVTAGRAAFDALEDDVRALERGAAA